MKDLQVSACCLSFALDRDDLGAPWPLPRKADCSDVTPSSLRYIMACSSVPSVLPSVLSLKATIVKLQKRVSALECNGGDSHPEAITKLSRETKDPVIVLHKRCTVAICKESLSTSEALIPTYNQLFRPPKKGEWDSNITCGKDFLLRYYPHIHHVLHCQNLRSVRGWVKSHGFYKHCNLHHNKEGKDELEAMIEKNYHHIKELDFGSATYKWEKDIYAYCLHHMQAKRKNNKNKIHDLSENTTLEGNSNRKEKDNEEGIERDSKNVREKESSCTNTLTSEALDDFYRPEIAFDLKSSYERGLDGFEDETLYDDEQELTKQGPLMTLLLQDVAPQIVQTIEEVAPKSLMVDYHEDVGSRKSKRTPKWSEKVKENMKRKKPSSDITKKKKLKTSKLTESLNEDASIPYLNKHEDVCAFDKEDEETILMKYLELSTIDALWTSLRSNFNIIKRNKDFTRD